MSKCCLLSLLSRYQDISMLWFSLGSVYNLQQNWLNYTTRVAIAKDYKVMDLSKRNLLSQSSEV